MVVSALATLLSLLVRLLLLEGLVQLHDLSYELFLNVWLLFGTQHLHNLV